jgi:hypothetical protein
MARTRTAMIRNSLLIFVSLLPVYVAPVLTMRAVRVVNPAPPSERQHYSDKRREFDCLSVQELPWLSQSDTGDPDYERGIQTKAGRKYTQVTSGGC